MKFYHASPTPNIELLQPHVSNHGSPLVYLTTKRANSVVYLSNAIEKFYKDNNMTHNGNFHTWASYGFNNSGVLVVEEYYPNATEETYKGVQGYIYCADSIEDFTQQKDIPFTVVTGTPVKVSSVEFIPDAYQELLKMEQNRKIILKRYEENSKEKLEWIRRTIIEEYTKHRDKTDYSSFLMAKFEFLKNC